MKLTVAAPAAALCLALGGGVAEARPVSYPGGWTIMQMNSPDMNSLHIHLSPNAKTSVGYYGEWNDVFDWTFQGFQANRLLKRWNAPASQGNLYLKGGVGAIDGDGPNRGDGDIGAFLGLAADWETRRWFVSYDARVYEAGDLPDGFRHNARIGVAPYVGDYGDLHTWLMLEVGHWEGQDKAGITPLVRFFHGVQLLEIGYELNSEKPVFNWIWRF